MQDVQDRWKHHWRESRYSVAHGDSRFDVVTRFSPESRSDVNRIRDVTVSTPDDQRIPLGQLADIRTERGAAFIYREANCRFIVIEFGCEAGTSARRAAGEREGEQGGLASCRIPHRMGRRIESMAAGRRRGLC